MSTSALVVEALDVFWTLVHAFVGLLIFFATVAAILILAAIACGAWAVDAALGRLSRRSTDDDHDAPPEPKRRRVPSWAHNEPYDYDEAA